MIQFACPGCSKVFTVGDEAGGRIGKCSKCQAQFTIPLPPPPVPILTPISPPPPADESGAAATVRCPTCRAKLALEQSHLSSELECPYCKTVFKLKLRGSDTPISPEPPVQQDIDDVLPPSPRSQPWEEPEEREEAYAYEEEERPRQRSRRRDEYDDDEYEDDRPRSRRRRSRRSRGTGKTVPRIISGILSLLLGAMYLICGVGLAVAGSTIMGLIGAMGPQGDQPGAGKVQGLAGVGMGMFLCCGLLTVLFGGVYITAGVGALTRRSSGRTWTIVVGVLSCLVVLSELAGGAGTGFGRNPRQMGMGCLQILVFAAHAVSCFWATLGDGADAEFNR